ncbi:MAG: Ppx/GppA family phosphatase [Firmicutes bacterium]|nr:Ppx/GppA family phosphatase [Bacillota bacterium]
MRVAAIDIGSNSVRLLVADVDKQAVVPVHTALITTRLGKGIEGRYLLSGTVERTIKALDEFLLAVRSLKPDAIIAAATSAVRDAQNSYQFVDLAKKELELEVNILSGKEEAYLTYQGVLTGLRQESRHMLVVDLGGGSTEFIWPGKKEVDWESVNVGAVRATEGKYSREKIKTLLKPVLDQIAASRPSGLIGVGGTVTNLAAMALMLNVYDSSQVHSYRLTLDKVRELMSILQVTPVEERKNIPGLQPERVDIIEAGTNIIAAIMEYLQIDSLEVSEADILYGLALEAAQNVDRKAGNTYQK